MIPIITFSLVTIYRAESVSHTRPYRGTQEMALACQTTNQKKKWPATSSITDQHHQLLQRQNRMRLYWLYISNALKIDS